MDHLEKIAQLLQLPYAVARKLAVVLPSPPSPLLTMPADEKLFFAVGAWLFLAISLHPDAIAELLKELRDFFAEVAEDMEEAYTSTDLMRTIPQHELHLAENRYAVWGEKDEFWDIRAARYINPLPTPPVWRTSAHLCGLFFRLQAAIDKERKDAHQPEPDQATPG